MKNKRLLSKALFKQSCKANGSMWAIIVLAVCFMLACVMLISGTSGISTVKEGIEETIIKETIKAEIKKSSIELYDTTDDAEYIFDKAFAKKINELNTYQNYVQIKYIKDNATDQGTKLVEDIVKEKVEKDVTSRIEGVVTKEVETMVKDKVTEKVTAVVTEKVTQMVKTEAASRLLQENDVKNEFLQLTFSSNGQDVLTNKIQELMGNDPTMSLSDAFTNAMGYTAGVAFASDNPANWNQGPYETLSTSVFSTIATAIQNGANPQETISNTLQLQIQTAIASKTTEEHQTYIASQIQQDATLMNTFTDKAKKDTNIDAITNDVLKQYKDSYIKQAKNKIATDEYIDEVKDEVLDFKQDKYVEQAKETLSNSLDSIENKATDDITEIIKEVYIKKAYEYAADEVMAKYPEEVDEAIYGAAMVAINPDNKAEDQYIDNNEPVPDEYINDLADYIKDDVLAWEDGKSTNTLSVYIEDKERQDFRHERAYNAISFLTASALTSKDRKQEILDELTDYNVDEEKYDSYGFDYDYIKQVSYEAIEEYQGKLDYEINRFPSKITNDPIKLEKEIEKLREDLRLEVGGSLLDKLPDDVTDGIKELGTMDLYGLIVGSIFFKMAGLLLPIIYVIMVSNNLIASQVDTGSMAYVLSTSTRRKEVTYTQALYLVGSVILMFILTCITSIVCFNIAEVNTNLNITKLIELNIGAFATMFAISGINFFASCFFDRSKRAMALGGGISMFFLVTTILGLFGSPVIPSVVRIAPLNYFNYVSIISLFDVISILDGTTVWMYKVLILALIGITGFVTGSIWFKKKDLPL